MRFAFITTAVLGFSSVILAQTHPNLDRGFDPNKVYQFDGVDSVDLYNGHLSLNIPIGGKFPVSERLSFGLNLIYNSTLWAFESWPVGDGQSCVAAEPKVSFDFDWNAGVGFFLGLGEMRYRSNVEEWVYLSPDGAQHRFFATYPWPETEPNNYIWYTQDGSFLRLTWFPGATPRLAILEFPGGTRHTLY